MLRDRLHQQQQQPPVLNIHQCSSVQNFCPTDTQIWVPFHQKVCFAFPDSSDVYDTILTLISDILTFTATSAVATSLFWHGHIIGRIHWPFNDSIDAHHNHSSKFIDPDKSIIGTLCSQHMCQLDFLGVHLLNSLIHARHIRR